MGTWVFCEFKECTARVCLKGSLPVKLSFSCTIQSSTTCTSMVGCVRREAGPALAPAACLSAVLAENATDCAWLRGTYCLPLADRCTQRRRRRSSEWMV